MRTVTFLLSVLTLSTIFLTTCSDASNPRNNRRGNVSQPPSKGGRCGREYGLCRNNGCCSKWGYCGTTGDYCESGCQEGFGRCGGADSAPSGGKRNSGNRNNGNDNNDGSGSSSNRRPGTGHTARVIESCSVPGTIAITFDDGPAQYTNSLIDILERLGIHGTFFINGNNYVNAKEEQYQEIIRRIYRGGHQVASHTLRHTDLTTISESKIREEMEENDKIIVSAIGVRPVYMRPPYGNTNDLSLRVLGDMRYRVINWGIDTMDFETKDAQRSFQAYKDALKGDVSNQGFIVLEHDTVESTALKLMRLVVPFIKNKGLRPVTVAECLGERLQDAYIR